MDIAQLSMYMSQTNVLNQVGIAVLSKSLDTMKESADGMIRIMEQSVAPHIGQNIDITL